MPPAHGPPPPAWDKEHSAAALVGPKLTSRLVVWELTPPAPLPGHVLYGHATPLPQNSQDGGRFSKRLSWCLCSLGVVSVKTYVPPLPKSIV